MISVFETENNKRYFRLSGVLGPFLNIHRDLIEKAFKEGKIKIMHNPLSCFAVKLSFVVGDISLGEFDASPAFFMKSSSDYHQILIFSFSTEFPDGFFCLPDFKVKVTLTHTIADQPEVLVGQGFATNVIGEVYVPLVTKDTTKAESAVITDLLRIHQPSLRMLNARSVSPTSVDGIATAKYLANDEAVDSRTPFIGDLDKYAGAARCFAALIGTNGPASKIADFPRSEFKKPHFFKNNLTPPYDKIGIIKKIVSVPYIAGIAPQDMAILAEYPEYSTSTPSGFLKFAAHGIMFSKPILPPAMAMYLLTLDGVQTEVEKHCIFSLSKAKFSELKNLVQMAVQASISSPAMADFMMEACRKDEELAVSFYWGLMLEKQERAQSGSIIRMEQWLNKNLGRDIIDDIHVGEYEIERLRKIVEGVKEFPRDEKANKLAYVKRALSEYTVEHPFRLPLQPSFIVTGVSPENVIVFGSSLQPVKVDFLNARGEIYSVILKIGDDMRQDALALSMIAFLDARLKQYGQNMCITQYKVLPVSRVFGLCQFVVGAMAISKVLDKCGGHIAEFFEDSSARGVFVKSCAGYSCISYILGVGDRHLDNLLVSASGNFLHVDYGFMFGYDPKPLYVALRVTQQMTEAMGDKGTEEFLNLAQICYVAMRRCADELCCALALMMKAGLQHLPKTQDALAKNMLGTLNLHMTDDEAGRHIVATIERSIKSITPAIYEMFHRLATM